MLSTKKNNSSSKGGSVSRRAKKKRKRRGRVVWKPKVVVWEEGGDRLSRGRRSKAQGREKKSHRTEEKKTRKNVRMWSFFYIKKKIKIKLYSKL